LPSKVETVPFQLTLTYTKKTNKLSVTFKIGEGKLVWPFDNPGSTANLDVEVNAKPFSHLWKNFFTYTESSCNKKREQVRL